MNSESEEDRKDPLSEQKPLSEKDFIQDKWSITSMPFWLGLFLVAVAACLVWGTRGWYHQLVQKEKRHEPFLEVTNRDFSAFLWQFPSFLRVHTTKKTGYLPGFLTDGPNFNGLTGEEFVSAPPDLIFLYQTWNRLLAHEFIARPISPEEFNEFLDRLPEWQPKQWKQAPEGYVKLIESPHEVELVEDWQKLPETTLPLIVRQAFQGWKNYFKEGDQINTMRPTFAQIEAFLKKYPNYARPNWRNIQQVNGQKVAGLQYLSAFLQKDNDPEMIIPEDQLASFLKVALFNAQHSEKAETKN